MKFQLTRPLRGATVLNKCKFSPLCISTHTPLAGRDHLFSDWEVFARNFNSHAPCGARHVHFLTILFNEIFQLTRPLRGATAELLNISTDEVHFNSHAPCGARRTLGFRQSRTKVFQLTRPLRGATAENGIIETPVSISTHTPLAGRDCYFDTLFPQLPVFQLTRPLRGATLLTRFSRQLKILFQLTRPLRGATRNCF